MYLSTNGLGAELIGWKVGQVLDTTSLAEIRSMQDELQHQSEMYAACKQERFYWSAALLGAAAVGYFIGRAFK